MFSFDYVKDFDPEVAKAMEDEGMEVLGVTSYGDLSQFAQQQSRASAFVLSIDDEEIIWS